MAILPQKTIHYKTYLKRAIVEALKPVFAAHPDSKLRGTKITIDYPTTQNAYPAIVIRYIERKIENAGVGHLEMLYTDLTGEDSTVKAPFKHYLYKGDIEFAIYALSTLDRDLISDALVQTLGMAELVGYTNNFLTRIYNDQTELGKYNWVNVNTDQIKPVGESQTPQPWLSEDQLVYQTGYRSDAFGEFYSIPPSDIPTNGVVTAVDFYPYLGGVESVPTGVNDSGVWE